MYGKLFLMSHGESFHQQQVEGRWSKLGYLQTRCLYLSLCHQKMPRRLFKLGEKEKENETARKEGYFEPHRLRDNARVVPVTISCDIANKDDW